MTDLQLNILDALRERDEQGMYSMELKNSSQAIYDLYCQGLILIALTPTGLRVAKNSELYENEIHKHFAPAIIFRR